MNISLSRSVQRHEETAATILLRLSPELYAVLLIGEVLGIHGTDQCRDASLESFISGISIRTEYVYSASDLRLSTALLQIHQDDRPRPIHFIPTP